MQQKKHGKKEKRTKMNPEYRPKIRFKDAKEKTERIRIKILEDTRKTHRDFTSLRSSGKYVLDKLDAIRKYIWAYSFIISKQFYYLETHAGPGLCKIRKTTKIVCGTPILALSNYPYFTKYRFIEYDITCYNSLNNLIEKYFKSHDARVIRGDCNKVITNVLSDFEHNLPTLCVIDPEGTEIYWETLESLSNYRTDLILLFPYDMAIKRCISPNCPPNVQYAVTRMYGSEECALCNYF